MIVDILLLIVGFVILIKASDIFVDGASALATRFKIPKLIIGLTIVAFGTSAPEFAVSMQSFANDSADMLLGNVIGSNIINILLIVGVCSLIVPIKVKDNTVKKEIPICLLLTALLSVLFFDITLSGANVNMISRSDGIAIILFFAVFIYYLFSMLRKKPEETSEEEIKISLLKSIIYIVLGIVAIVISSDLVVNSAINISRSIGISERIISLTVIAFGTSLPELVTSVTAARKKELDILIGNVIGSNIFNICIVLGIPVAIFGNLVPETFQLLDFVVVIIATILLYLFSRRGYLINRMEGIIMLATFALYYGLLLFN